jgi:peptidoglycan/xylan/chitin deacetylase (PgdA/CDA1 family)
LIAGLEIARQYLPDWFVEGFPAHVPIPADNFVELQGEVIAWGITETGMIPLLSIESGLIYSQCDWDEWKDYVLEEKYRDMARPFYTRLPFHYHHAVPANLRNVAMRVVLARRGSRGVPGHVFPGFPVEQGFELLHHVHAQIGAAEDMEPEHASRVILTHDIDTSAGFRWVRRIAELEKEHGFRSLWNVVGCAYRIEYGILDWLVANGFEIGLHGHNHDNKLAFLSESEIRHRLDQCEGLMRDYEIRAFRSPSWFRNEMLFAVLRDYFEYDYSRLDTDILCPGGKGGCLWTKTFSRNGLTHVPTTLPFEVPLFLGHAPEELLDFWKPKVQWLESCGGNIVVNTHPDPHYSGSARMLNVYEKLLLLLRDLK